MAADNTLLDEFATKTQVAESFGVTERTIDRWVRLRVIPQPRKVGRQRLWHLPTLRKSLTQWAAA
jgi:predicted DNA-binding transcriptional regulator AlpA